MSSLSKIAQFNSDLKKGTDAVVERKHNSKGHEAIRRIHVLCYPHNKIIQNTTIELSVGGKKVNCEFDIVDKTMNLTVEIQGRQHYEYVPFFHKDKMDFIQQQVRDEMKRNWALENNFIPIEISDKEAINLGNLIQLLPNQAKSRWISIIQNAIHKYKEFKSGEQ